VGKTGPVAIGKSEGVGVFVVVRSSHSTSLKTVRMSSADGSKSPAQISTDRRSRAGLDTWGSDGQVTYQRCGLCVAKYHSSGGRGLKEAVAVFEPAV
jgi:hypothetical protein